MSDTLLPSLLYLWDKRTLYIGPLTEVLTLSQGAATLVISLDNPISFITKEMKNPIQCRSILLPASLNVTVNTRDATVANCNLDTLGSDFFALKSQMKNTCGEMFYNIEHEEDFVNSFSHLHTSQFETEHAYEVLDHLLNIKHPAVYQLDKRIEQVVDLIKHSIDDNLSVEDLAKTVNLSAARLIQLFKKQTGIPIRRFRLWHRLFITAVRMGMGENLTQAAIAAGFTDSSHFSHTFRDMFGMSPSSVLMQKNGIKIMAAQTDVA